MPFLENSPGMKRSATVKLVDRILGFIIKDCLLSLVYGLLLSYCNHVWINKFHSAVIITSLMD